MRICTCVSLSGFVVDVLLWNVGHKAVLNRKRECMCERNVLSNDAFVS
jgi:hypothetical protein